MKTSAPTLTGQEKLALVEKAKAGSLTSLEAAQLWESLTRKQRLAIRIKQRFMNNRLRQERKAAGLKISFRIF